MKEAKARIKINKLLENAGWRFFNKNGKPPNIVLEPNAKIIKKQLDDFGDDFEKTSNGFIDYLLLDEKNFPICIVEAKSEDKDPLSGKEQAREYADSQNARFIILSNGNIHYFWDKQTGNPTQISVFPSLESLHSQRDFKPDLSKLIKETISEDFITRTKFPSYDSDPLYVSDSTRQKYLSDHNLNFLRYYQLDAVHAVQKAASENKNRFLFEMATGTGKTLVSAAVIKLFLKTGNAERVLFLVDRLELEEQAKKNFVKYLSPDYSTRVFKENKDDWRAAEIVVTTIQSISHNNKYLKLFTPFDFDLIISDEAHRSISGNNRAIFEYFIGSKLGLTATPKDYLKNLKVSEADPREVERRTLLSTYKTFGCESGVPTYRYSLQEGAKDGFLVNPIAIDCRTEITTKLLSENGYAVQVDAEDEEAQEIIFKQQDFEKTFFSEQTNNEFVKVFLENAMKDPITNEIGKTIIFCVKRSHASKITQILNAYAHQMYPGKYNSDFAVQVTSDVRNAQQMTVNFANNNLNGQTNFLEGYKSSKTRVCVTVGMMTTGYDCEDVLNICMMRPIFSPTDFVQIRGRGTRKYKFKYKRSGEVAVGIEKEAFKLFDFFANCEYFEDKFPYDEVIDLPSPGRKRPPKPPLPPPADVTITIPDPLKQMEILSFDGNVMRIDKELYSNGFESKVKELAEQNPEFKEAKESGDYETMEKVVKENLFNKPEEYYDLEKLRQSYNVDRRLSLFEILDKIFGKIMKFKSKEDIADDEFEKFKIAIDIPSDRYYEFRELFKLCAMDNEALDKINKKDFSVFSSDPVMWQTLQSLGEQSINQVSEYFKVGYADKEME